MEHSLIGRAAVSKTVSIGSSPIVPVSGISYLNKRIVNECSDKQIGATTFHEGCISMQSFLHNLIRRLLHL